MADPSRSVLMVLEATFPKHGGGGAESQVLTIGQRLLDRGVGVQVVVPMVADGPQVAREDVQGLDVVRIAYPKIRLAGGAIMLAKLAWYLIARRRDYAVIHAHIAHNMASVASVVGSILGKPVVVKLTGMREMSGGILDANAGIASRIRKWAIQRATRIQATSSRIRHLLVEQGFEDSRVLLLPNGVDVARFAEAKRDAALRRQLCGDARLVGIFVGRLAPEKGHELLLEAWAEVFGARTDAKLVLVGDGVTREPLQQLALRLGIGSQVVFAGHSSEVARHLAIADFGLLTSFAEGLSNSLLEYMASGLPVVGSKVSGTEDFVREGDTGWLFEPGRKEELVHCLAAVARLDAGALRKVGDNARTLIVSTASLEAVAQALVGAYGFQPATETRAGEPLREA
jgi:glycosyltransferase involved in cell wall biosynthesis